jgi:apolipoprotein N-acyltransferase
LFVNPLIALSALLYVGAFILPSLCHWFVFIWLIPLYSYVSLRADQPLHIYILQGFWWGVIFFTIHMYALIDMLIHHTSLIDAIVVSLLLITYCAAISACWFAIAALFARGTHTVGRLVIWVLVTCAYIEVVQHLLFKIICLPRGYVFAYPLVPLMQHYAWIASLMLVPPVVLIGCICAGAACVAYSCIEKNYRGHALCAAGFFFFPCMIGWCIPVQRSDYVYQDICIWAEPPAYNKNMINVTPLALAQAINEQLCRAVRARKQATCILFPESTFPFPLDRYDDIRDLWVDNALFNLPEMTVVIGSHHSYGHERKNTVFCLKQCRIMKTYDKNTYLPFAEYIPWPWNKSRFFSEFLLKDKRMFRKVTTMSEPIHLTPELTISPYICSDLFFNGPRCDDRASAIVWLVNDSWFTGYYRHLMFLHAQLQAHLYKRTILYIAHEFGACIAPYTQLYYLTSIMIPKNIN